MRVLLDVNVVLDVLLQRHPWLADAQVIWDAAEDGRLDCCIAASSLTDIFYISRRLVGVPQAREIIKDCLDMLTVLPVDHSAIQQAHARPEADLEDALQIVVAVATGMDALVTRDSAGFQQAPIPVWTPPQLVQQLQAGPSQ